MWNEAITRGCSHFPRGDSGRARRLFADAEFEADLDHLISQAQLSSGEEVVLRGLVDGLEGHGLEYYAKPHGISPNSVRQMKKRALDKVGKVIE